MRLSNGLPLQGYQSELPLLPAERRMIRTLMLGRLAMSLGMGAKAALEQPENAEYVLRTQAGGWVLLRLLWGASEDEFAAAAGLA